MKKMATLALMVSLGVSSVCASTLESTTIKMNYSKQAKKASKRGTLSSAGFFMNKDQSKLYKLSAFVDKKTKNDMFEIQVYDAAGKFQESEVLPLTQDNLNKYDLVNFDAQIQDQKQDLENLEVTYIDNPTLAGKPSLVNGVLTASYAQLGVFERFKFQKQGKDKLNDKFWAQVYYPVGDNVISRNNYLVQPKPEKKFSRALFSIKNSFMPKNGKAYIGGMKAVSSVDVFLSGIMDLNTSQWVSKHEIKIPHKIYPGNLNYIKLENDETGVLIPSKDKYSLLLVDNTGAKKNIITLGIEKTGGQHGYQPSTYLFNDNESVLTFVLTASSMSAGKIGLSVSKVSSGKETWSKNYSTKDLSNAAVLVKKDKVKIKKLKAPSIQAVTKVDNGDYLVSVEFGSGENANFLVLQVSADGDLLAAYPLPGVPKPKAKLLAPLPIQFLKATDDSYFAVVRSEVDGYQKGQYTDVSSYTSGDFLVTTTTSFRNDDAYTAGYVLKLDLKNKTTSNIIRFKDLLSGDFPVTVTNKGSAFVQGMKVITFIQ